MSQAASGMNYSVTLVTPKGLQWLSSANLAPLRVMLPANMVSRLQHQLFCTLMFAGSGIGSKLGSWLKQANTGFGPASGKG